MDVVNAHIDAARALVAEPDDTELLSLFMEGYVRAVIGLEGTFEGALRGRGAELLPDGRIRTMPALGLAPEEARAHAYELLVIADLKEARP